MASYKAFLLLFALLPLISIAHAHTDEDYEKMEPTCTHDDLDFEPELLDIEEDLSPINEGRILQNNEYPNMRFYVYYDFLNSAPASYKAYIQNELTPPVIDFLSGALRVKYPVKGNLRLASSVKQICGENTPDVLFGDGVEADYFTFFDSRVEASSVVASSRYCYLAGGTRRPLVATTNFNRNMLREAKGNVLIHEKNMYLLIHEIFHTLGISKNSFPQFIDENGNTRKGHMKSVKIAGLTRTVIDVPPLTEKLRQYYGCSSLEGLILENNGGSGTAISHLERKFFLYETMASGGIFGRRVSEFSLGLLEGSGWYAPDYSYAEPYYYGQGQGCSFVQGTCGKANYDFEEFCSGSSRGCAPHGIAGGMCGSDSKTDGCRYYNPDEDWHCENPDAADNTRLADLQVYGRGEGSKCFTGSLGSKSGNSVTSFCFKYNCVGEGQDTQLQVLLGKNTLVCEKEGKLNVDGYSGTINCPDPLTFCNTVGKKYCPRNCMNRGTCVNNKCECKSGFKGVDCGLNA